MLEVNGLSGIAIMVMLLASAFLIGRWVGQQEIKVGTPSASHNSAMLEIASVVKELAFDIEDDGTVQAEYYCQRINAVLAQLQQ